MSNPSDLPKALDPGPNVSPDATINGCHFVFPGPYGEAYTRFDGHIWLLSYRWNELLDFLDYRELNEYLDRFVGGNNTVTAPDPSNLGDVWVEGMYIAGVGVVFGKSARDRDDEFRKGSGAGAGTSPTAPTPYTKKFREARPEAFIKGFWRQHLTTDGGVIRKRADGNFNPSVGKGSSPEPEFVLFCSRRGMRYIPNQTLRPLGIAVGNDATANIIEALNILNLPEAKLYDQCMGISRGFLVPRGDTLPVDTKITLRLQRHGQSGVQHEDYGLISDLQRSFHDIMQFVGREKTFNGPVLISTGTSVSPVWVNRGDVISISAPGIGTFSQTVIQDEAPAGWLKDDDCFLDKEIERQVAARQG